MINSHTYLDSQNSFFETVTYLAYPLFSIVDKMFYNRDAHLSKAPHLNLEK